MSRSVPVDDLRFEDRFLGLCRGYAEQPQTLGTEQQRVRRGVSFAILRRVIRLELLLVRASFGEVRNLLYCRIYPCKTVDFYYLLPELFVGLEIDEYRSCFFTEIESEDRLERCFLQLTRLLDRHLPAIEAAAAQGQIPLEPKPTDRQMPEERMRAVDDGGIRDGLVSYSYSLAPAYRALLCGQRSKAVRLLERARRKGRSFRYQDRLCAYLKRCGEDFLPMPEDCNAVLAEQRIRRRAIPVYLASFAVLYAAFTLLFWGLGCLFLGLFTRGCAAYFSVSWEAAPLLAGLPAMFGGFALRKKLATLVSKKHDREINRLDRLKNSRGLDVFTALVFAAAIAASLFFFAQIYGCTVRIYPDRLDYAAEESVLRRQELRFDEIREICHVSARYNVYGDRIERSSYVIVAKDGRRFDLNGSASEQQCERILFPLLAEWKIPFTEADTARELP